MGMGMEAQIANQLRKGQGETNDRLDRIIAALERNNLLLEATKGATKTTFGFVEERLAALEDVAARTR